MKKFDAIIIGSGQSGPALAQRLTQAGMEVAVIERARFGGTCVNTGCSPTKTLIASSKVANTCFRAGEYGIKLQNPPMIDMPSVKARKDAIVQRFSTGVENWLREMPKCTVYTGHATFSNSNCISIGDVSIQAKRIFINVGGRARIPTIAGLDKVPYYNNSTVMDVDFVPPHLIVLGGGYIALEFAQMYRRFGSEVTVLQRRPRILPKDDEDITTAIRTILENEGIRILTERSPKSVSYEEGKIKIKTNQEGGNEEIVGTHLLIAVGRQPNTHDLGLEKAHIATDDRGFIIVDKYLRTSTHNIWAIGDCNGRGAFTHTSYNDYEIVAENLLGKEKRKVTDRIITYALFIDPPLGRVGMTEKEALATEKKILVGKLPMTRVSRAIEKGETEGFMKILVDAKSKQILGASLLGTSCDEVVHLITDIMYAKAPYTVIRKAMHIHPTVAELIPTLLGELQPLT